MRAQEFSSKIDERASEASGLRAAAVSALKIHFRHLTPPSLVLDCTMRE
jgi:hypothetical protein